MLKTSITPLCLLLFTYVFYGCNKPDAPIPYTPDCQIVKLKGGDNAGDSAIISYNSLRNPTSMIRNYVGTGSPNYFFRYDKQNRLSDVVGAYSGNVSFETWHHYVYGNKKGGKNNLPVTDSVYTFGTIGNGPLPTDYWSLRYTDFSYDSYGRIIKAVEVDVRPYPYTATIYYHYNAAGNLDDITTDAPARKSTVNSISSYDNKINPHRTNPIWQLIDRDYSLNNPSPAVSYNAYGLPTVIGHADVYNYLLGYGYVGELEIVYDCQKAPNKY
jgi:hypothetical protein